MIRAGRQAAPSSSRRTPIPTTPLARMTAALGMNSPAARSAAASTAVIGPWPAAPSDRRSISAAAGSVAAAHAGASATAVSTAASHAGSDESGIMPCCRAASRRRGVAGIVRSDASDIRAAA